MSKYLDKKRVMQNKHKKRFAFGISASVTAIIAIVWVTSFSYFNSNLLNQMNSDGTANGTNGTNGADGAQVATNDQTTQDSQSSPINVIRNGMASVYESITGSHVDFVKKSDNQVNAPTLEYVPGTQLSQ